jgi:hypothetical protein
MMRISRIAVLGGVLLLSLAVPARGQIGVQGGVNIASAGVSADGGDVDTGERTAWHVGGYYARGGLIGFHGGVYYSQKGFSVGSGGDVDLDYIEIPLMLRVKFLMLRAYAGPNLAFEIDCKTSGDPAPGGVVFSCSDTENFEFGWKVGAGGKLLIFSLDLAYEWGTRDVWGIDNGSIKNRAFQVTAGIGI